MQSRLLLILRRCNNSNVHKYTNPNSTVSQQDLARCFQTLSRSKLSPTGRGRVGNNTTMGYVSPIVSSSMRSSISTHQQQQEQDDELFNTEPISTPSSSSSTNTGFMSRKDTNHTLDFTNASIKRLLQEELLSMEKSFQNISPQKIDDNIMTKQEQKQIGNKIATDNKSKQQQNQPTMAQLIHKYQKNNDESISSFLHQPPPDPETTPLDEIQHFFEFQSQQETVSKYEVIIKSARERSDYTSLSIVQRNLLNWYTPLRQKIIEEQEYYFTKKGNSTTAGAAAGASIDDDQGDSDTKKGINKYGPYLCALQAEKLAILTTHEATMFSLFKGNDNTTLVTMALKISDAIEAEVNVQRLLKMRMDEKSKLAMKNQSENNGDDDDENFVASDNFMEADNDEDSLQSSLDMNNNIASKKTKSLNDAWMYGPSHLQRFVDELNRSNPGRKGKVRIQRANRRAMQLLESAEPWPASDKVALGVVLIKMLLDTAKVNLGNHQGKRLHANEGTPAFTYEKKWVSENNLVGCVTMNEDFYKMVVEDKFCSLDAFTTRHKPMVIPPKDWSSFNDGGYMVLETEFMRSHGCHIQKVRKILFLVDCTFTS